MPRCWCAISRPRKRKVTLTLSLRRRSASSPASLHVVIVLADGRAQLDFLDLDDLLLLRASLAFFCCSYLYLP